MDENKRKKYANLYEDHLEEQVGNTQYTDSNENYLRDIKEIEEICAQNDLEDEKANRELFRMLRKGKPFSTWVGNAFLSGLSEQTGRNRHRRTIEKVCRRIAFSFLAMAVVLLGVLLYFSIREAKQDAVLAYIRQEREQLEKAGETQNQGQDEVAILNQYAILYSMYPDVVGWLKVDGTPIDYPVMQNHKGEEYYLNHNFEGKRDNRGALFVSSDAQISPQDKNIVIFGHNVKGGSQFGELDRYLDKQFYKKHPTFQFDTVYERGTYQVVAVVRTQVRKEDEEGFRYYWCRNYENRSEFQDLFDFVEDNRLYKTGEHIAYGDTTIMLSTCEYTKENGRLVVVAKKV